MARPMPPPTWPTTSMTRERITLAVRRFIRKRKARSNAGARPKRIAPTWITAPYPGCLERQIGAFVDHYNNHLDHESLSNLTAAVVDHGRSAMILRMRERIKCRQPENAGCSTNLLPPKRKQKPNRSLRYKAASALRKTLTTGNYLLQSTVSGWNCDHANQNDW